MANPSLSHVEIYTDGACSGNPGPGGWGTILIKGDNSKELSGFDPQTTNNRMELQAVISGLQALTKPCQADIYTDSRYVADGIKSWMATWKANNWRTSSKKPVKNADLWQILDELLQNHQVTMHWVKGHSGHELNERADELARNAIELNNG